MALETLKGIKEIGGFNVLHKESGGLVEDYDQEATIFPIAINHDSNCVSFRIQDGPIKENGVNGCQVDTIIETAKTIIEGLNKKFPCSENTLTIAHLGSALAASRARKKDREKRNVEGTNRL